MKRPRAERSLISAGVAGTGGWAVPDGFARDLERQLGSLLRGGASPYAFRGWFASALWAAEGSANSDTLAFAYEIENIIAERSGDHITDDEMLGALRTAAIARYGDVPAGVAV